MLPSFANIKAAQIVCPGGWFVGFLNKVAFLTPTSCLLTYLPVVQGAERVWTRLHAYLRNQHMFIVETVNL